MFMHELKKKFALYASLWNQSSQMHSFRWTFEFDVPQNKKTYTGDPDEDYRMMLDLAFEGLKYRYPKYTFKTTERLEKEMKLIYELGFTAYFLINWDICRFARERGFFYVGRGSGANSMVAYCLRITDVDPIDLDLYFERFINPFRSSPPDFDIDFSWQDRDTVTDYILTKYGNGHSALLATYNTFQTNAVVRELGKVYGLPKSEIDALLERHSYFSPKEFEQFLPDENTVKHSRDSVYSTPGVGQRVRNRVMRSSSSSSSSSSGSSSSSSGSSSSSSGSSSSSSSNNGNSSGNNGSSRTDDGSNSASISASVSNKNNRESTYRESTYIYDSDTNGGELHQDKESLYGELLRHAQKIHNLPNYRSLHVGGILISEKSLYH
jgi:DNA polymerase III alpha subunit